MKIVVDSNYFRDPELEQFLREPGLSAVLTETNLMEAYKGNDPRGFLYHFSIIKKHPEKVIVLKDPRELLGVTDCTRGIESWMVNERITSSFADYCKELDQYDKDTTSQLRHASIRSRVAQDFDKLRVHHAALPAKLPRLSKEFKPNERAMLNGAGPYSPELIKKIVVYVFAMAKEGYDDHPEFGGIRLPKGIYDHFLFRFVVCSLINLLRYVGFGNMPQNVDRNVNAFHDMTMALYGTYFDGVLSKESSVTQMRADAIGLLDVIRSKISEDDAHKILMGTYPLPVT